MTKISKLSKRFNKAAKASLCLSVGLILATPVMAEYPKRPISLVIPYGPGGATDISARALARSLDSEVSKPLVLVNRTGAGGVTGSASVAHARGDGYTVLAARVGSHTVNPAMKSNLPYELSDFKFLGVYEINPIVCATNKDSGIDSIEQLVSKVKSNPGTVSYSSSGVGSFLQLSAVMILDAFGVDKPQEKAIHLPMRGGGEAVTAVLNRTATFICDNSSTLAGFINNGLMIPLIVTTKERIPGIDAPTVSELNHPELEALLGWTGIAGPKDMDSEAVDAWEKWIAAATRDPEFVGSMEKLGSVIVSMSSKESEEFISEQYEIFKSVVERLGIDS